MSMHFARRFCSNAGQHSNDLAMSGLSVLGFISLGVVGNEARRYLDLAGTVDKLKRQVCTADNEVASNMAQLTTEVVQLRESEGETIARLGVLEQRMGAAEQTLGDVQAALQRIESAITKE